MSIENLMRVVPPPVDGGDWTEQGWARIETNLRTNFPPDFKGFSRHYGSGYFLEYMAIEAPRASDSGALFRTRMLDICGGFLRAPPQPYEFWPSPGGLLPFASTENAEFIFWLPRGTPEEWKIVVWGRDDGYEIFDRCLTDFLAGLVTGEVVPAAFSSELLLCECLFDPDQRRDAP